MSAKRCHTCGAERLAALDFCLGCAWRASGHEPTDDELQLVGLTSWTSDTSATSAAASTSSTNGRYRTPFQSGALWRSFLLTVAAVAIVLFASQQEVSAANPGMARIGLLIGAVLAVLVVCRAAASSLYRSYPVSTGFRALLGVHDVLGTFVWFSVHLAGVMLIAMIAALFKQAGPSLGLSGGDKTAIGGDGVVYRKNSWTGSWEPEQGLLGPRRDSGLFGPNIKQGFSGPKERRNGAGTAQYGSLGEKLYERK
jgi:hypothetical protein